MAKAKQWTGDVQPTNEVYARGVIQSMRRDALGNQVMILIVKERRDNLLTLTFVLEQGVGRGFHIKDRVEVYGYTRAYQYYNDALSKKSEVMYFVATDVKKAVPELTQRFGVTNAHFYPTPLFRGFVAGTVKEVKKAENAPWGTLTVETCGGGGDQRPCTPILRYFTAGYLPLFDYRPGDKIVARVSARTPKAEKPRDGADYYFQNLIVEDIACSFRAPRPEDKRTVNDPTAFGLPEHVTRRRRRNRANTANVEAATEKPARTEQENRQKDEDPAAEKPVSVMDKAGASAAEPVPEKTFVKPDTPVIPAEAEPEKTEEKNEEIRDGREETGAKDRRDDEAALYGTAEDQDNSWFDPTFMSGE